MGKLILLSLLFIFSSILAHAEVIRLSCTCIYGEDYVEKTTAVRGFRTNPDDDELQDCKIKNGKVESGCWAAKVNAQYSCEKRAEMLSGRNFQMGGAYIDEDSCFGSVE